MYFYDFTTHWESVFEVWRNLVSFSDRLLTIVFDNVTEHGRIITFIKPEVQEDLWNVNLNTFHLPIKENLSRELHCPKMICSRSDIFGTKILWEMEITYIRWYMYFTVKLWSLLAVCWRHVVFGWGAHLILWNFYIKILYK